jgi:REP element-mobilizing transposase RayT
MSDKYKITNNDKAYFITSTVVGWIDLFTRNNLKDVIAESLNYCVKNKGLLIYSWCLMPSHLHMICSADSETSLSDILRDFKTFTSKKLINEIKNKAESRKGWLLDYFSKACSHLKRKQEYNIWQDGNQAKEIFSNAFLYEKLDYIHNNPVKDMIVENAWEYLYSSARNYADMDGLVDIVVLGHKPLTIS